MSGLSVADYVSKLKRGLETRNIDFVVSEEALGCNITEVYVTEARELIIFPGDQLDTISIQWILQVRTPLKVRITFFSTGVSELKIRLLTVISKLKRDGLEIPQTEQAISVQDLTENNIQRLLDSFEKWVNTKTNGRPVPFVQTSLYSSSKREKENYSSSVKKQEDLHEHLRDAIKIYWTERYFARYMNIPSQNVKELANRIGIQHQKYGHETLYFFDRKTALVKYFEHIIKGILDELKLKYRETSNHDFFLPDLRLRLHFFNGEEEQMKTLAGEHAQNFDLIVIDPEPLGRNIGQIQDYFFQVLPLDQDKIKSALIRVVRQRIDHIAAYSSGIIH